MVYTIDPQLRGDICRAETCKLAAYKDTNGFWTIGWGHKLPQQSFDYTGTVWTQYQADAQLDSDIMNAANVAMHLSDWQFFDGNVCRQNAMIELIFNMGQGKWGQFHDTRAAIAARDWPAAKVNLLNSAWANEVHATRANRIANYLLNGDYNRAVQ